MLSPSSVQYLSYGSTCRCVFRNVGPNHGSKSRSTIACWVHLVYSRHLFPLPNKSMHTSRWGQMKSTQESWQEWSPSPFPSSISSLSWVGKFCMTGGWSMWCLFIRKAVERVWETTYLSVWPQCQGGSWSRSSHGTARTRRRQGSPSMALWKTGLAWQTWSLSVTRWCGWWKNCGCHTPGL